MPFEKNRLGIQASCVSQIWCMAEIRPTPAHRVVPAHAVQPRRPEPGPQAPAESSYGTIATGIPTYAGVVYLMRGMKHKLAAIRFFLATSHLYGPPEANDQEGRAALA